MKLLDKLSLIYFHHWPTFRFVQLAMVIIVSTPPVKRCVIVNNRLPSSGCGNDVAAFAKLSHVTLYARTATDGNMSVVKKGFFAVATYWP